MKFKIGGFVLYEPKNELGLVKSKDTTRCFVWYHMGGTAASTPLSVITPISNSDALKHTFSNEYAKASLFERQASMKDNKNDVTDLIDQRHIRLSISRLIDNNKEK